MSILIKNAQIISPVYKPASPAQDILIEENIIVHVGAGIEKPAAVVIDAEGKLVMPGLVDMHVHLREPGREDKETILTGTRSAAKGGVTTVLAMPNTTPAMDCPGNVSLLKEIVKRNACVNVAICGSITRGRLGQEVTDIAALKKSGITAISDDGSSVDDDAVMEEALKRALKEQVLVICHSEDKSLSQQGVVNLGFTSTRMGLRGISKESEYKRVARDLALAQKSGCPIHIAHVSCRETVELIAKAKKKGVQVTCETAPHYFSFSEEAVLGFDTNMKMNPPLRGKDDVLCIKQALSDGTIDVIASDHAPHTENEKDIEFDRAEFGVIGLETGLAASITELVATGILSWPKLVEKLALNPARILGREEPALCAGKEADLIIIDPDKEWLVTKAQFISKSKNSGFIGRHLKGVVERTICSGKIIQTG